MRIQAFPVTSDEENNLYCSPILFDILTPVMKGPNTDYRSSTAKVTSSSEEKITVLVIDVKGLQKHNINEVLLKKLRIRGARTWFMTHIECVDDVFDAFNTDAEKVLVPTHSVRSESELIDILNVSDSSVPTLFVRRGTAYYLGKAMSPRTLVDHLSEIGFSSAAVIDTDGTVSEADWNYMFDEIDILPCSFTGRISEETFRSMGFGDVLIIPA